MQKILFVIPDAGYSGAARQLSLLATGLPRTGFMVRVVVLGGEGPLARALRDAGVAVDVLGWTRLVDFDWLRRLRDVVHDFRPDVIHAIRLTALRAARLAGLRAAQLIASDLLTGREKGQRLAALDRWLVRRLSQVVARGPEEAISYRTLGIPAEQIAVIPPAVLPSPARGAADPLPQLDGLVGAGDRVLLGLGPIEPHKGFRDAVWAMGILRFLPADPHLILVGSGSDRARLEEFAHATEVAHRVHFVGEQPDVTLFLARADLVWMPSRSAAGRNAALEAMAAGRAVVASRRKALAEIVEDGVTGWLVAPGDKVALARYTRLLLDDADLRGRQGDAGRRRAAEHFSLSQQISLWQSLYEGSRDAVRTRSVSA
jgi:glycosyltransferase involved in cell wall biosynthesis